MASRVIENDGENTPVAVEKRLGTCDGMRVPESRNQAVPSATDGASCRKSAHATPQKTSTRIPKRRQLALKWNGWGYNDSRFELCEINEENFELSKCMFTGRKRYSIVNKPLPYFSKWVASTFNMKSHVSLKYSQTEEEKKLPPIIRNEGFLKELEGTGISHSFERQDRLFRAHGQSLKEITTLRESMFQRIPDIVVWPACHSDVETLVQIACKHNTVIIPFGGGTNVSRDLECPVEEKRMIVSLDTSQMNKIIWVDKENMLIRAEAGITGEDLEKEACSKKPLFIRIQLSQYGLSTGHEPDSYEFSTLGGWVSTRASGMKRNLYGNIEDMVIHLTIVTPKGVLKNNCQVPRMSSGPDLQQSILGSEGTLGVITEVTLKVQPIPKYKEYGAIVFPNFQEGVACLREIARQPHKPASIRLLDNDQVKFGNALRTDSNIRKLVNSLKMKYLKNIKGFDLDEFCVASLLFEGNKKDVEIAAKRIYRLASKFRGIPAGKNTGLKGYLLTFVIAYMRDIALDLGILGESFETSIPWDRCVDMCTNVKDRVSREFAAHGVASGMICCRVTQSYASGACVYFYLAIKSDGIKDPLLTYEEIETATRDEVLANGGSISHHHGVGKLRKRWLQQCISDVGVDMLQALKENVDPQNIFANGNLMMS